MTPLEEKSTKDMAQIVDQVLANLFAPDESPPRRVCQGCGEFYYDPDAKIHICEECERGREFKA